LKKEHGLKSSGKDLFDASVYKDGNSTSSFHHMVRQLSNMTKDAEATPFHHLLATLADEGRLLRLYSQNVDGIDTALQPLETTVPLNRKGPWPKTIQLHGGLQKMVCSKCNDMKDLDADLFDGPEPPTCEICIAADNARTEYAGKRSHGVGRLRPRMVLYNEHNPDDEAIGAVVKADMRTRPDCLIVVGTTLKIPGVKRIVKEMGAIIRGRRDGLTIWVNMDGPPPSKDYEWDLIVKGPCDQIAHHAAMRKWNEPKAQTVTPEEAKAIMAQSTVRVVVPPTPKKNREAETSMPTPASSRSASVPPVKKADKKTQKKLVFVQDGLPPKDAKVKAPAKRGKAANKPLTKGVKFVKKATTKQPAGSMQKLAFGISKAGKTASTKSTKKDSKPKSNLPSPAPMAPISPVDAKINSLPAEQVDLKIISSQLERMEPPQQESPHIYNDEPSPPWSPTTPYRHRHYDVESTTRARKTSIDFLLNPASESTGIQDTELLEDAKRNSISI
jgi:NAD-dependent histone deacetylase SIR2